MEGPRGEQCEAQDWPQEAPMSRPAPAATGERKSRLAASKQRRPSQLPDSGDSCSLCNYLASIRAVAREQEGQLAAACEREPDDEPARICECQPRPAAGLERSPGAPHNERQDEPAAAELNYPEQPAASITATSPPANRGHGGQPLAGGFSMDHQEGRRCEPAEQQDEGSASGATATSVTITGKSAEGRRKAVAAARARWREARRPAASLRKWPHNKLMCPRWAPAGGRVPRDGAKRIERRRRQGRASLLRPLVVWIFDLLGGPNLYAARWKCHCGRRLERLACRRSNVILFALARSFLPARSPSVSARSWGQF